MELFAQCSQNREYPGQPVRRDWRRFQAEYRRSPKAVEKIRLIEDGGVSSARACAKMIRRRHSPILRGVQNMSLPPSLSFLSSTILDSGELCVDYSSFLATV